MLVAETLSQTYILSERALLGLIISSIAFVFSGIAALIEMRSGQIGGPALLAACLVPFFIITLVIYLIAS